MYHVPDPQSQREISDILDRLVGRTVSEFHVFGINSLKSVVPAPADLVGSRIVATSAENRILELRTQNHAVQIDLQRTGRLIWLDATPAAAAGMGARPTARLLVDDGQGIDFTEPAKTKRIVVRISGT